MAKPKRDYGPRPVVFRPHTDVEEACFALKLWCKQRGTTFNAVMNAYIPRILHHAERYSGRDEECNIVIRSDLGDVTIK